MWDGYDADPVAALTTAMQIVLERDEAWPTLVHAAGFEPTRSAALLVGEPGALDALARDLNECRTLPLL